VPATIALLGLAHPHAALYLQTLNALAEVGRLVCWLVDSSACHNGGSRRSLVGVVESAQHRDGAHRPPKLRPEQS
jgi:hypothetical protein